MTRALGMTWMLCLTLAVPTAAQPPAGPSPERVAEIRAGAEAGDASAQYLLGRIYHNGAGGVAADLAEAARWYRKAAEAGLVQAQVALGFALVKGEGVAANQQEAARWLLRAAEQGDHLAQLQIAEMYASGQGVPANEAEAIRWNQALVDAGGTFAGFARSAIASLRSEENTSELQS